MKDFFAKCGCNCGHCPAFKGNSKTDEDRQRCSDGWHRYLGAKLKPEICQCEGCQSSEPWKSGNVLPDRSCNIRPCALHVDVKTCAYCYAYPCEDLEARTPGEDFRERIESVTGEPIPEDDYLAFIKPYEGLKHLKEMRAGLKPKDIAEKVEVPPIRARIIDFPDDLPLSKKETEAFKKVHGLLSKIISPRAETYAKQLSLKRRRPHTMGLLWIMGLYGKSKKEGAQLVLDSKSQGLRAEYGWLVRKRDNTPYQAIAQCFGILKGHGVRGEFVPSKKDWKMKLTFNKNAGGKATLNALKSYVDELVDEHGEPVYAGSSRFKGKAFQLFSKADMRTLK